MASSILHAKVATTEYINLATALTLGVSTIDGVLIYTGDRILVKAQGSASLSVQNGIYTVNGSGVLARTTDFANGSNQQSGQLVIVAQGTNFADTGWTLASDDNDGLVTIGTDQIIFSRFSGNSNLIGSNVPSSIVLRAEKGYPLTIQELDNNFKYLATAVTEKLNITDFTQTAICDRINSVDAAIASLDAYHLRGFAPTEPHIDNTQTIALRATDGSITSPTFIGDLSGNAATATNAETAELAGNVTGVVAVVHGGTGSDNAPSARIALGAVGIDGSNELIGKLKFSASTTGRGSLNIPSGVAPNAPEEGDIWTSATAVKYYLNGLTETVAALRSPALTGAPTAPTADKTSNSTNIATTAYVQLHVSDINTVLNLKSPIASPTFTGTPLSTTPATSDNSTRIATTAYTKSAINDALSDYYNKLSVDTKIGELDTDLSAEIDAVRTTANTAINQAGIPVGAVIYYAANAVPIGYLQCNGASLNTLAYPQLFAKIGYTYGGSGTTFKVPDLRGEFIRGHDDGRGIDPGRTIGSWQKGTLFAGKFGGTLDGDDDTAAGVAYISMTGDPSNHLGSDLVNTTTLSNYNAGSIGVRMDDDVPDYGVKYNATAWLSIARPRNVAMVPCIKAFGAIEDSNLITATAVLQDLGNKLDRRGDTMTGLLTLSSAPTLNLHAATKKYVDDQVTAIDVSGVAVMKSGSTMTGLLTLSGAPTADLHASTKKYVDDKYEVLLANSGTPVGTVMYYANNSVPIGWLECNGASLSIFSFPQLFAAIGYTYGGSGNNFKLPELRGEFLRGHDNGRGVDSGRAFGSWQKGTLVSGYDDNNAGGDIGFLPNGNYNYGSDTLNESVLSTNYGLDKILWQSGSRVEYALSYANNWVAITRPRNVAMKPCIKAFGAIDDANLITASQVISDVSFKVDKRGDTMTGLLTLSGAPTSNLHAATKKYVDDGVADAKNTLGSPYTFTYGNTQYAVGYTNIVGSWNNDSNYFDIYPPSGKAIGNLVAFIPSIAVLYYAGGVNYDDATRCTWGIVGGNRIRVWVQNTEQRSTPAANWLAIWR